MPIFPSLVKTYGEIKEIIQQEKGLVRVIDAPRGDDTNLNFNFDQLASPKTYRPVVASKRHAHNKIYNPLTKEWIDRGPNYVTQS